jgi:acyl-homoserine-lactone acylase
MGWAQMHSHGNLLLRLYGQARGRAAEYFGADYLDSDRYVRTMGIPARSQQWYDAQSPQMQAALDAFAAGINAYGEDYPDRIDDRFEVVLPIKGADVLAHIQRALHFHFVTSPQQVASLRSGNSQTGSNAWAISPLRSQSGEAMLLANPHLPWSDLYLWYEAQMRAPGIDAYGATLVGIPMLTIAFNDNLGWTFTVNTYDGADAYELTLVNGGYRWDGEVRPFDVERQTIQVKQADGTLRGEELVVRRSSHGPVIAETGDNAIALRVAGLDRPQVLEQFWDMARAENLEQFEAVLQRLQLPMFNLLYSDREGNIFYIYNGLVPVRDRGNWDDWQGVVPGDTSATLWTEYHPYSDLPRLLNPATGWLQNANDPPWTSSFPQQLYPGDYPPYLSPPTLGEGRIITRPQRSIKMLKGAGKISFEEMISYKFSSHLELADRLLDDLIPAAREFGNELAREAADVLEAWDRKADAESRGAVLFARWAFSRNPAELFATPWQESSPLMTPDGLANPVDAVKALEQTAAELQSKTSTTLSFSFGALDVPWGEVFRMSAGEQDVPASGASGGLGCFRVLNFERTPEGRFQAVAGDTFLAAIEFSEPVRARVLLTYGNATQPGSPHIGDQLPLYARDELRPALRSRQEVEANLELRQVLD